MADLMGITVEELVSLLKKRKARLPFEIGAFVALQTCETLIQGPAVVSSQDVRIAEDGSISLYAPPNSASGADAARSVVSVLAHLLVAAGPGVPPLLLQLVEHGPSDGRWDLGRLRDELEASLIPLNRAAARRVLSRLLREVEREPPPKATKTGLGPQAPPDSLDADLDAFLGDGAPPSAEHVPFEDLPTNELEMPEGRTVSDTVREDEVRSRPRADFSEEVTADFPSRPPPARIVPEPEPEPPPRRDPSPVRPRPEPASLDEPMPMRGLAEAPEERVPGPSEPTPHVIIRERVPDLDGFEDVGGGGSRGWLYLLVGLLVLGAVIGGLAVFRPETFAGLIQVEPPARPDAGPPRPPVRAGDLMVHVTPDGAQVLMFVGRGPAVVKQLPTGVAHEFVAIADGRAPTRAVVPPDVTWEQGPDGPLYELAIQTGDEEMSDEDLALGETLLERGHMGSAGDLGTVRIITTPRGAKVYHLIGFAPTVTVRSLPADEAHELLVWAEGYRAQRVVVGPSNWEGEGTEMHAEINVDLEEITPSRHH